ncbi:MAG: matrixin family metalloprotease [Nitrosopumilus sp.]
MNLNLDEKKFDIIEQLNQIEEEEFDLRKTEEKLSNEIEDLEKSNSQLFEILQDHSKEIKEIEQEKITLNEINSMLENKVSELSNVKEKLKQNLSKKTHLIKELEQQKLLLTGSSDELEKKNEKLQKLNSNLLKIFEYQTTTSKEEKQQKLLLSEISQNQSKENHHLKKKYLSVAIAGIVFVGILAPYSFYMTSLVGEDYMVSNSGSMKSGYLIQNLRGDTIDTYLSWRLVEGDTLHINILNHGQLDAESIDVVKNVILSTDVIEVDDSLVHKGPKGNISPMYVGWKGALFAASAVDTSLNIPVNFEVIESNTGEGDITITLTNQKNADGFSGWTNSIADESQNQILKSKITIFDVDSLSKSQLETIVRHEMGHALGLAHSTAPEDLMHPTVETNFPYISNCDIDAIQLLYDGGKTSQVVCET